MIVLALVAHKAPAAEKGSNAPLTFSQLTPTHALQQASSRWAAPPAAGCAGPSTAQLRKHTSAASSLTQLKLTFTREVLTAIKAPVHSAGRRRRRHDADGNESTPRKKMRDADYCASDGLIGKRPARDTLALRPPASGGTKRKDGDRHERSRSAYGMKRKSAAGCKLMLSVTPAHCRSGSTNCAKHSAGGSLGVGGENATEILCTIVERPVD